MQVTLTRERGFSQSGFEFKVTLAFSGSASENVIFVRFMTPELKELVAGLIHNDILSPRFTFHFDSPSKANEFISQVKAGVDATFANIKAIVAFGEQATQQEGSEEYQIPLNIFQYYL